MNKFESHNLTIEAFNKFGHDRQILKLKEEIAEAFEAITSKNRTHSLEELTDVLIVLDGLLNHYGTKEERCVMYSSKLQKLERYINEIDCF
jgi:NTP pyrophosphatase (non-canonical NTP hydrolase)